MKTAIITGASTGIGKAVANKLAKNGYRVLLVARSSNKLDQIVRDIKSKGGEAEYYTVDLTDELNIKGFLNEVIDNCKAGNYSGIDAILNIAGIWHDDKEVFAGKDFETFGEKVITDTYSVGFTAPSLIIHGLLPYMNKGSHIINLSGTFENGGKGWIPYYASKKALEDLTYGLADELKDQKIYVNGISPSDTATEEYTKWFPEYAKDAVSPEKIAELFLDILRSSKSGTIQVIKKYDYNDKDIEYLKMAIEMSHQSYDEGAFPAGAVIVKDGKVISKTTSTSFPKINFHPESKSIDIAINELNEQLTDCMLYASMEPCLMCLSRAYWAGIRKIVFAVKKENVPHSICYESNLNHYDLLEKFNEKIELVNIEELQEYAIVEVKAWLEKNS
ncbi:SDR family NAD(P)-dependent oxidoreductase [Candidatus Dojkabacteria bacterium]|nr:SDR family NAD(P)-dependent oxidoreductase [Candidatus Dojkabacteria bacterium]